MDTSYRRTESLQEDYRNGAVSRTSSRQRYTRNCRRPHGRFAGNTRMARHGIRHSQYQLSSTKYNRQFLCVVYELPAIHHQPTTTEARQLANSTRSMYNILAHESTPSHGVGTRSVPRSRDGEPKVCLRHQKLEDEFIVTCERGPAGRLIHVADCLRGKGELQNERGMDRRLVYGVVWTR